MSTHALQRIGRDFDPDADQLRREVELRGILGPHRHAHILMRVRAGQGAAAFCRRYHRISEALGETVPGRPCSPHCTLYGAAIGSAA